MPAAPDSAATRLGSWLGWADAIGISQVLSTPPGRAGSAPARSQAMQWASAELEQIQGQLASGFSPAEPVGDAETVAGDDLPAPLLAPYLQHFAQQQRVIASRVSTFRASLRARLAPASAELARLAQLDEYIERALAAPEQRALAGLSALLERRARKHFAAEPHGWRPRLGSDLQRLLRADLDQRLQPVLGLMEALSTSRTS